MYKISFSLCLYYTKSSQPQEEIFKKFLDFLRFLEKISLSGSKFDVVVNLDNKKPGQSRV